MGTIKNGLNFKLLVILLVFLLGFLLRLHNFAQYPQRGATHDEFAFAFLGISFLQTGIPTSWSNIPVYQNKYYLKANETYYSIVTPYFDHPPLFGLLTGGFALLNGETEFLKVKLSTIRLIPAVLGSLSIILLFKLCQSLSDFRTAVISCLIFATVPTYVISSRMSLAENLLIPEILLALILFEKLLNEERKSLVYLLGFLAGLAFLTKFVGLFVWLTLLLLFLYEPRARKHILPFSVITFLVGSVYFLYGFAFDKALFLKILSFQGAREVGPFSFLNLFLTPAIVNKIFVDGWVYFGWFALAILIYRYKENIKVVVPALCYLLVFVLTVNQQDLHGWYNYPFYPFLAIASGKLISQMLDKPSFLNIIFLLTAGLSTLNLTYFNFFGMSPTHFRILVLLFFLPFFFEFFRIRGLKRFVKRLFIFYLIVLLFLNIISVITYIHPA
jgi:4-amino-4-deoxy-L-arabinose transferase-like glycosyltransferase